jgi:hypothetical protein
MRASPLACTALPDSARCCSRSCSPITRISSRSPAKAWGLQRKFSCSTADNSLLLAAPDNSLLAAPDNSLLAAPDNSLLAAPDNSLLAAPDDNSPLARRAFCGKLLVQNIFSRASMQDFRKKKANRLVRMMIVNWAFGWAVGFVCAGALLASNLANIRVLMFKSEVELQFLLLLFGSFGMTFGGVVAATAIMLLPVDEEPGRGGGAKVPVFLPAYAFAKIRAGRA